MIIAQSCGEEQDKERSFSPRRQIRRLKELTTKDARSMLLKNQLGSIPVFDVNPRILRIPDAYPKSDEEEFKEYSTVFN